MRYISFENWFDEIKRWLGKLFHPSINEKVDNIAHQKEFAKLDADTKHKLLSPQLGFFTDAIAKRSEVVPVMSTLAATLIVVTTLNKNLVPLQDTETKALLTLFLILIPGTLHFYIRQKEKAMFAALKIIASYQGDRVFDIYQKSTFMDYLQSAFPRIVVYLFYGAIGLVIFRIWFGQ